MHTVSYIMLAMHNVIYSDYSYLQYFDRWAHTIVPEDKQDNNITDIMILVIIINRI